MNNKNQNNTTLTGSPVAFVSVAELFPKQVNSLSNRIPAKYDGSPMSALSFRNWTKTVAGEKYSYTEETGTYLAMDSLVADFEEQALAQVKLDAVAYVAGDIARLTEKLSDDQWAKWADYKVWDGERNHRVPAWTYAGEHTKDVYEQWAEEYVDGKLCVDYSDAIRDDVAELVEANEKLVKAKNAEATYNKLVDREAQEWNKYQKLGDKARLLRAKLRELDNKVDKAYTKYMTQKVQRDVLGKHLGKY